MSGFGVHMQRPNNSPHAVLFTIIPNNAGNPSSESQTLSVRDFFVPFFLVCFARMCNLSLDPHT